MYLIIQNKILNHIIEKMATELQNPEISDFMKEVSTQGICTFELGTPESINVPIWKFTDFRQSDREHNQDFNNDTFL